MKPVFSRLLGSILGAAVASGDGPWRAKTVWVAVLITALGFGLWVRDAATNDGNSPATASGIAVSTDGTAKPATWDFSRPLPGYAQVSGSYIGGFVLGWLFRRFIRMALALAAGLVLLLGIGKYAGWDAPKTEVRIKEGTAWVEREAVAMKDYLSGLLPSASAAGVGGFLGLRRRAKLPPTTR
jgi:uncharacterized membrane protein (Fun14 family)